MQDCLFCKIIEGQIPADIVYRDEDVVAFKDINPQAPVHILVIPVQHLSGVTSEGADDPEMLASVFRTVRRLAREQNLDEGFRVVVNCGENGGQTVGHLHFHILGKRVMGWPPG